MTISTEDRKAGPFACNGVLTLYAFEFKVFNAEEVRVVKATSAGVESDLTYLADFTVALNADQDDDPGGTITTSTAYAAGNTLTITSDVDETQGTELPNAGGWFPKVVENALDRAVVLIQQLAERVTRGLRQPISDAAVIGELPTAANRRGRFLAFTDDAEAQPMAADGTDGVGGSLAAALAASGGSALVGFPPAGRAATTVSAELALLDKAVGVWFVDSVGGSDGNSGRAGDVPYLTIAKLLAQTIQPGDRIWLKRGSSWRERLTVPEDSITVDAYGDGADPILDCANVIASGSWTKVGGLVNVYSAAVVTEAGSVPGAADSGGVWVNGTRLTLAASAAACDATPGSWFPFSSINATPLTLYVHSTGSTIPTSDGKTYEYAKRATGIDTFSVQYCTIRNITTKRNFQSYGSLTLGKYCKAYDCHANEGAIHNVFLRGGAEAHRVTATDAGEGSILFVHYEQIATAADNVLYEDCVAVTNTPSLLTSGFYGHAGAGVFGTATFRRCTSTGCYAAFDADNLTAIVFEDCDATGWTVCFGTRVSAIIRRGVQSTAVNGSNLVQDAAKAGVTISVDGVTASITGTGSSMFSISGIGNTLTLKSSKLSWAGVLVAFIGTGGTFSAHRNTYIPLGNASFAYSLSGSPTLASDNNNFGGVNNGVFAPWIYGTSSYWSLEAWSSATDQDTSSSDGNTLKSYEKLVLFDDFLGDVLDGKWHSAQGTDVGIVAPAVLVDQIGGVMRFTTGNDAGNDMAANGVQFDAGTLSWNTNSHPFVFECRIKVDVITNVVIFIGVTDQWAALEMPFTLAAGDVLTSNATDAVGVLFDTAADTDNWWLVGVQTDVDAAKQNAAVAPVAGTYETWRIEVNNTFSRARFYRNGVPVGASMSNAILTNGTNRKVTPVIAAFSRNATAKIVDVDYVLMESAR